ncbi:hypothetical protein DPMN_092654 [Dreissena polymorpha]|uniref:Uncharacterized protein n=1 Tax=Dreissena polymorpha TaxID=45954 RepID=A0A9D4R175_DREPO|nr:hypothetical protein DPMN_092654 [Dreissena polymorpha]
MMRTPFSNTCSFLSIQTSSCRSVSRRRHVSDVTSTLLKRAPWLGTTMVPLGKHRVPTMRETSRLTISLFTFVSSSEE